MDAKKSDVGKAHERGKKTKIVGAFVIAALIAMAVFVGTAAADGDADIVASKSGSHEWITIFSTINNVYGWGNLGDESQPNTTLCGPAGCGGRVYIVNYSATWTNGTIPDDISGGYEIVHWDSGGHPDGLFDGILAWPKNLIPGKYTLVLDLNCTGYNGVWTNISDPAGGYIKDPTWSFTVKGPSGPEISINKTASITGSCPGTDPLSVSIGDNVTYCFNVTNTGNVTLTNLSLFDDHYGTILLVNDTLLPDESLTNWTITHIVTESDIPSVINTATVNSTDPDNKSVNDTDICTLNVDYNASIEIVKTAYTSGSCPGSDPLAVYVGDNVTYCFNVTNTGNVSLSNVSLSDDHYGTILLVNDTLLPDESLTNWTITYIVTESDIPSVINTATVNSTDPDNKSVNDTDVCTLNVDYNASIVINKTAYTSGSCPGSDPLIVHIGDNVTYCFNVTNTGNVTLTNLSLSDDHYGTILLVNDTLLPGESLTNETITYIGLFAVLYG